MSYCGWAAWLWWGLCSQFFVAKESCLLVEAQGPTRSQGYRCPLAPNNSKCPKHGAALSTANRFLPESWDQRVDAASGKAMWFTAIGPHAGVVLIRFMSGALLQIALRRVFGHANAYESGPNV